MWETQGSGTQVTVRLWTRARGGEVGPGTSRGRCAAISGGSGRTGAPSWADLLCRRPSSASFGEGAAVSSLGLAESPARGPCVVLEAASSPPRLMGETSTSGRFPGSKGPRPVRCHGGEAVGGDTFA